jgi:hypothetical protein
MSTFSRTISIPSENRVVLTPRQGTAIERTSDAQDNLIPASLRTISIPADNRAVLTPRQDTSKDRTVNAQGTF